METPPGIDVWFKIAPESRAMPYVVFSHDFMQPDFMQGGHANIEQDNITFNVYAESSQTAESVAEQLMAFYDFKNFATDSDEYCMVMMRQSAAMWLMRDWKGFGNKDVWLYEVQYSAVIGRNPPGA